jgi:hypothetical protein
MNQIAENILMALFAFSFLMLSVIIGYVAYIMAEDMEMHRKRLEKKLKEQEQPICICSIDDDRWKEMRSEESK